MSAEARFGGAPVPSTTLAPVENPICALCTQQVDLIKARVDDAKTIDDLKQRIEAFCEAMAIFGTKRCEQMINENLDKVVGFVKQHSSKEVCSNFQLC